MQPVDIKQGNQVPLLCFKFSFSSLTFPGLRGLPMQKNVLNLQHGHNGGYLLGAAETIYIVSIEIVVKYRKIFAWPLGAVEVQVQVQANRVWWSTC